MGYYFDNNTGLSYIHLNIVVSQMCEILRRF